MPDNILNRIVDRRRTDVESAKREKPLEKIAEEARRLPRPAFDFLSILSRPKSRGLHVIAEVKKASPSKGLIREDFHPIEIARQYAKGGASALSILTEPHSFLGSDSYLQSIAAEKTLPCLRKDFLFDPYQIYEAKILGASAILLIVACLSPADLKTLRELTESLGMTALVEVHDAEETHIAIDSGARLIGINNRDLRTFKTDLRITESLRPMIPIEIPVISESGIFTPDHLRYVAEVGSQAVLIGESLMRQLDPGAALAALLEAA
jgi:indole-3-glycerol phosphate synthase